METASLRRRWTGLLAAIAAAMALGALAPSAAAFGFITSWGGSGNGPGQFGEGSDVAVGPDFDVYVTDRFNDRVQVFSPLGAFKRAFPTPESFGIDVVGNEAYLTDFSGGAVEVFSTQGASLRRWGSVGTANQLPQPRYSEPWGIDVGGPAGNVYVADSINNRIMVTSPTGGLVTAMGIGMLASPFGVAVGSGGSAFVADTGHNQIIRLDPGGTFFSFGSQGSGNGQFSTPWDVAFGPDGDLFVVDRGNDRIQRFTSGGSFLGKFGTAGTGPGQLQSPEGLAVDAAGNVYVADIGNDRISRFGDRAGLSATVTSLAPSSLTVGQTATLALRVANSGPDASRLAGLRLDLPAGAAAVSGTATQGTCSAGRPVTCALGTVPAGAAVGVTVIVRATGPGALPLTATAGGPTFDPDPTNDVASATLTAAADPSIASGPRLRVAFARLRAHWVRGRSSGTLEVTVDTPRSARVQIALLRGARGKPVQRWAVALRQAGQITRKLRLGGGILPGRYTVRVRETAAPPGGALPPGTLPARLAPPPEGVVASAFISRGVGGRGVRRIAGPIPGFIFANFRFAAVPRKASRLRVDWFWSGRPGGPVASKGVRPVRGLAVSPLRSSTGPLPAGRYRAVVRHGRTVLAVASVTLG